MERTLRLMFCPRCAAPMVAAGRALKCVPGDMELSEHMLTRLVAYVESPAADRIGRRWEGMPLVASSDDWFCPADGAHTALADGMLCCTRCGGVLNDYVYELIRLSPHRSPSGGWT